MDKIKIRGGNPLHGTVAISGAKNAALPLMAASLLTAERVVLTNVPRLEDIKSMAGLLGQFGAEVVAEGGAADAGGGQTVAIQAAGISGTTAPYDLVRRMRASVLVLGPLVARCGEAKVSLPGGCAIGTRPIDLHLKGLESLGTNINLDDGYVRASAPRGLRGANIRFPFVSVGATENLMMAACLADGETVLENAAREPEIADLGTCLQAMGADIEGLGTERLIIQGTGMLHGTTHAVMPDRIETGSYAVAAAITGGDLELKGVRTGTLDSVLEALSAAGVECVARNGSLHVRAATNRPEPVDVTTQPYPGFPTDMQAQFMALMTLSQGTAVITESIFENRFMHVPEVVRMGANILLQGPVARVRGVERLRGAQVMATDLRASMSLILAGLSAAGETEVSRIYHLDRGYDNLVCKLAACGADIQRVAA
ncbi:MAG TPA: UDP-N-acetylglucosamine 1-carboxyvinyltransferase [Alphaproteobacteria bacterium]|nr:UDP-N-acetylglucosamine 1-carboxyvinyltransferase [Alphaproteobacteria bacterium]